jgi:hypothetical protein
MMKNRYTKKRITYTLKQAERGIALPENRRKQGIAKQTF